jgi:hypothetical protein
LTKGIKQSFFYYFAPFCDVNFVHSLCSEANILKRIKANRSKYLFSFEANILKRIKANRSEYFEANIR